MNEELTPEQKEWLLWLEEIWTSDLNPEDDGIVGQ